MTPTPHGAQRRLRALHNRGWSPETIARCSGVPEADIRRAMARQGKPVSADLAASIATVYDRLWNVPPPAASDADRALADSARELAHARGWPPPLGWDDDVIDDPHGRPAEDWKPGAAAWRKYPAEALAENAQFVREHGGYRHASLAEVAMRLGVSKTRLDVAERRASARAAALGREAG